MEEVLFPASSRNTKHMESESGFDFDVFGQQFIDSILEGIEAEMAHSGQPKVILFDIGGVVVRRLFPLTSSHILSHVLDLSFLMDSLTNLCCAALLLYSFLLAARRSSATVTHGSVALSNAFQQDE